MKHILFLICFLLFLSAGKSFGQSDSLSIDIENDLLSSKNMVFEKDSTANKIVSAGRISRSLEDIPLTVYVITHDEILLNQYTSLVDVLRSLPAIMVSQPGSGELGESFQIRGLTGNHYVKILINGLPVKPSVVSGMPFGSQLPIRQAERIEVIYGTASAIYGADAVSGVVNIITKEASKGTFARGDIGLGQGGYNYINFMAGGKGGKNNNILQYSFYGSKTEHNNMNVGSKNADVYNPLSYYQQQGKVFNLGGNDYNPLELTENILLANGLNVQDFKDQYYGKSYEGSLTAPDMEDLSSSSHMVGLQMEFRGVHLSYNNMYRRTHSSIGLSPVFYKYNNPQNFWGENISQTNLGYSKDFRYMTTTTNLSSLVYRMDNNSNLGITFMENTDRVYRYSASNDILFEQVFTVLPISGMEIAAGFSWQRSGNLPVTNYSLTPFNTKIYKPFSQQAILLDPLMGSFGYNPQLFTNSSAFLQFYYLIKKFRILGGLRYDNNTLYGDRASPQIALMHKKSKKTSSRISFGTAYKAAPSSITFQSLAYPNGLGEIIYKVAPNTALQPEKFTTLEYGINSTIFKRLEIDQTFYFYRITNHIVPIQTSALALPLAANDSVTMWINSDNSFSNVLGSQTNFRVPNIVKSIKMDAELSLSFLQRRDEVPNVTEIVKDYLSLIPSHEGKLKVSFYPIKPLYLSVESQWMSKWLRLFIPFESIYNKLFKEVDGFYSMNLTSSYSLSPNLRVYFKVINLFDENYGGMNATILEENLVYNPQMRRSFRFGLTYNLN